MLLFGGFTFPSPARAGSWKAETANPKDYRDWKGDLRHGDLAPRTVRELLAATDAFPTQEHAPGRLEVEIDHAAVRVRGFLDDDGVARWGSLVLSAFRAAASAGARGCINVIQPQGEFGYAIGLEGGRSRLTKMLVKDLTRLLETNEAQRAAALFWERFPKVDEAALEALVQQRLPPRGEGGSYAKLVDALARAPTAELVAAATKLEKQRLGHVIVDLAGRPTPAVTGRRDMKRVTELWPTAADLITGLRSGATSMVRAIAVYLVGVLRFPSAIDAVVALLRDRPESEVISAGFHVLRKAKHPAALELMFEIVREPPSGVHESSASAAAVAAIASTGDKDALRRLQVLLTPEVLGAPHGAALAYAIVDSCNTAKLRWDPDALLDLWSAAKDVNVRNLFTRILWTMDRETLTRAVRLAGNEAERRAMETARKRAKPSKKARATAKRATKTARKTPARR